MIKIILVLVLSTAIASAWFTPKFGLSGSDTSNVDKSFVRDNKKEIVIDTKRSKMYSDIEASEKMNFAAAQAYCQKMNLLSYRDWRVPTKEELRSLLELSRRSVTIKHAFKNVKEDIYWSSTQAKYNKSWYFDFDLGRYGKRKDSKKFRAFCVRSFKQ